MNDKLGVKIFTEFVKLVHKTYSHVKDGGSGD